SPGGAGAGPAACVIESGSSGVALPFWPSIGGPKEIRQVPAQPPGPTKQHERQPVPIVKTRKRGMADDRTPTANVNPFCMAGGFAGSTARTRYSSNRLCGRRVPLGPPHVVGGAPYAGALNVAWSRTPLLYAKGVVKVGNGWYACGVPGGVNVLAFAMVNG